MRRVSDTDIVVTSDDRLVGSAQADTAPKLKARTRRAQPDARKAGQPKPVKTKRRIRLPRLDLTPLQKLAAAGVGVTALVVGGAVFWHSGILQRTAAKTMAEILDATADAGFRVADITVSGRARTGMDDIAQALDTRHGAPILAVSLSQVKGRLEAIASVKTASVERHLPDSLHIRLTERQPVAIWQNNGAYVLVDKDGQSIPGPLDGFGALPLVVGDGAGLRAAEALALVGSQPALAPRVKAVVRVGNRRWNLMLDDAAHGIEIRLPEDDPKAAWARFAEIEKTQPLSGRAVSMVDLRTPDRLILKTERPVPAAEQPPKRKDNGA
jgi:cell division protein FtsQ